MTRSISEKQGARILLLARETIGGRLGLTDKMSGAGLDEAELQESCGTFVTLKLKGNLRGCIGNLEPTGSIVESVRRNALSAAFNDHRFSPMTDGEFSRMNLEISILSKPHQLPYSDAADLIDKLRPGIDGVILQKGSARATFLPQVWEQLPEPSLFLNHLCQKAGILPSAWQDQPLDIFVYQVQSFKEERE